MTEHVQRVYTIVYFDDDDSGNRRYLVGTEAVLHNKALAEMSERLSDLQSTQRKEIATALRDGEPIIDSKNGRILSRGAWLGGNAGGVLLIGRPALFGGRVEKHETPLAAVAREVMEEMRVPLAMIDGDADARAELENCFEHVCDLQRPGGNRRSPPIAERYFALDLKRVQNVNDSALRQAFVLANLLLAFAPQVVDDARDSDAPADTLEKVALQGLDAKSFVQSLDGAPCAQDVARIRSEAERFGRMLCDAVGVDGDVPNTFVQQVVDFQMQRRIPNHVAAARAFLEHGV